MAKEGARELVTVDRESLEEIIESKVQARLAEQLPIQLKPAIKTLEDRFEADMKAMRGNDRPPLPERTVACKSPLTGSSFGARVVESRGWPQGRVVELLDYKHPDGLDKHKLDGGLVPDGLGIRVGQDRAGKATLADGTEITISVGDYTPEYKMWRYQEFWKRDLMEFVGKPFQDYIRARAEPKAAE